ncbi:MAG: polysaccharide deacetylase family protein [Solirubrobacterales bacterium]
MVDPGRARWRPSPFLAASAGLHAVSLAGLLVSPASWGLVLTALVANHLAIGAAVLLPRCAWLGPNITRVRAGAADGLVALTFDDGPDPEVTPAVLGLLERAGAKATFFCVGQRAEAHPEVVAAIRAGGHGVENHTYSHPNGFALRGPGGISREIRRAQEAIERVGGGRPSFFRAPAGIQSPWLAPSLATAGLRLVSWTRRGYDTVSRDGARVAARLERGLTAGDILLMHDGSSARDVSGRPVVLEALPRVLEAMGRRGLRSETLGALLERPASEGP